MMKSDKQVKENFRKTASQNPEKYYATEVLKEKGFSRKKCSCGTWFWTPNKEQKRCGDPACSEGFTFFKNPPCKNKMSYTDVWKKFSKMFKNKGYKAVKRYPVVARWNPTMEYTIASIAAFQPYVVSGEVEPPAKKLVIPQFCLRFDDIDNVGVTMNHMTGFVMIGQHSFVPPEEWNQKEAFKDIYSWLTDGLELKKEEITFHEDAWAGGGNFGPCMEFFSRGVELGNQVYMMYEQTSSGKKELGLKVLDMGMGHERNAWFSQGEGTIYDATFPEVIERLKEKTGVEYDEEFLQEYTPYASFLNLDEVEDIEGAWSKVSKKMGVPVEKVKKKINPLTALYSVAEHSRSLLFALADGGLPSNAGGGYNLRNIFRRAQSFIDKQGWNIKIEDVAEWHAEELKEIFPELLESIGDVKKILNSEKRKYYQKKERGKKRVLTAVERLTFENKKSLSPEEEKTITDLLVKLYDTEGVNPEDAKKKISA